MPVRVPSPRRGALRLSLSSACGVAAALGLAALLAGQEAPAPTPSPGTEKPAARKSGAKPKAPKAPVDFSGVWELDPQASQGVVKAMENAVIRVKQNGDRIWMEPLGTAQGTLLAEELVVDGQLYEKKLGKDKGTVLAKWGTDNLSLWIEAVNSTPQDPRAAVQRMVWRLQDFGNTWTRQSWTISGQTSKQAYLVFRKRPADWVPTPAYFPKTPTPAPAAP